MKTLKLKRTLRISILVACLLGLFVGVIPGSSGDGVWTKISSSGDWIVDVDTFHASDWSNQSYDTSWFAYYDNFQAAHFTFTLTSGSNDSHVMIDFFTRWKLTITNDLDPSNSKFINITIDAGLHYYQPAFLIFWGGTDQYYNWGWVYDNGTMLGNADILVHGTYMNGGPDLCDPSRGYGVDTDHCYATWAPQMSRGGSSIYREVTIHFYVWRNDLDELEIFIVSPYAPEQHSIAHVRTIGASATAWDLNFSLSLWNDYSTEFYQDPYEARGDPTDKHYASIMAIGLDGLVYGSDVGIGDPLDTSDWGILEPLRQFFFWVMGMLRSVIPDNVLEIIDGYVGFFWEMADPVMDVVIWVGANWINLFMLINMILVVFGANEAMKSGDPRVFIMPLWNFWMGCIGLMMRLLNLTLKVVDIIIPF